ncbi:hypothetical protein C9421_30365, partial [Klebsiella pneumoniae]
MEAIETAVPQFNGRRTAVASPGPRPGISMPFCACMEAIETAVPQFNGRRTAVASPGPRPGIS